MPDKVPAKPMRANNLDRIEFTNTDWRYTPTDGVTINDMTNTAFWSPVASQMHRGDIIRVIPEDGNFYAELLVRVVEPFAVKVHVLMAEVFDKPKAEAAPVAPPEPGYTIAFKGPQEGWTVVRDDDRETLFKKGKDAEEARAWLRGHLKKLAA